ARTGPVQRGDVATIRRHLEALTHGDAVLYRALGRAALELAQKRGMDEATAAGVATALATDLPPVIRRGTPKLGSRSFAPAALGMTGSPASRQGKEGTTLTLLILLLSRPPLAS